MNTFEPDSIPTTPLSKLTQAEMRASHAGETGAVWIYRGIRWANLLRSDPALNTFASTHLETERQHLQQFERHIVRFRGSALLILWAVMGFLTGALPALLGRNWTYYTIYCVESYVDEHYQSQIKQLTAAAHPGHQEIIELMQSCNADEIAHRDEALHCMSGQPSVPMRLWGGCIKHGSACAVLAARWI